MDSSSSSSPSPTPPSEKDSNPLDDLLSQKPSTSLDPEPSYTTPLIPQTSEYLLIFSIYAISLLLSSLSTALVTPTPSYFSQKHNLFNIIFAKYGWFWTSLVFFFHLSRLRRSSPEKAFLRWLLATLWWYFVARWCFGPPIMDRMFMFTGGKCQNVYPLGQSDSEHMQTKESLSTIELLATSAACKLAGGHWHGGHDLSGHVFLLTHASLFLWMEFLPVLLVGIESQINSWTTRSIGGLLGLWWWMLVMTGIYFHTWREKLTGFLASLLEVGLIYLYIIPTMPVLRNILGVPGT